jgi:hypothetical protein
MIRIKYLSVVLILALLSNDLLAQRRAKADDSNEETYKKLTSVGVTTNTNSGIIGGLVFRQSAALSSTFMGKNQFRYLALELVNVKHPKEVQQDFQSGGGRLVNGKLNYLFVVRPEYGRELTLFNRHEDEGIAISAIVAAGPSLGIEKPYMVQYQQQKSNRIVTGPYNPTQPDLVVGAGGFFQGFGLSKIVPGLHIKTALSFELSAFRESVTGLEIGFIGEAFARKIDIMAYADNRSFYTSGYITLYFGNKKR